MAFCFASENKLPTAKKSFNDLQPKFLCDLLKAN